MGVTWMQGCGNQRAGNWTSSSRPEHVCDFGHTGHALVRQPSFLPFVKSRSIGDLQGCVSFTVYSKGVYWKN